MKKKKYFNYLILIIIAMSVLYVYGGNIGSVKMSISQSRQNGIIGELLKGDELKQYFTSEHNNFVGVSIKLATFARVNKGHIIVGVKEAKSGRDVYTSTVNTESIADNDFLKIRFPPVKFSNGILYYVYIQSLDGTPGQAITAYKSNANTYPLGDLYLNGKKQGGDAVFQVYYNDTFISHVLGF